MLCEQQQEMELSPSNEVNLLKASKDANEAGAHKNEDMVD